MSRPDLIFKLALSIEIPTSLYPVVISAEEIDERRDRLTRKKKRRERKTEGKTRKDGYHYNCAVRCMSKRVNKKEKDMCGQNNMGG